MAEVRVTFSGTAYIDEETIDDFKAAIESVCDFFGTFKELSINTGEEDISIIRG